MTIAPTSCVACCATTSDTCATTSTTASTAAAVCLNAAADGAVAAAAEITISSTASRICAACVASRPLPPPLPPSSASRALALASSAALACVAACGSPLCSFSAARESTESTTAVLITGSRRTVAPAVALADAPKRSSTVTRSVRWPAGRSTSSCGVRAAEPPRLIWVGSRPGSG